MKTCLACGADATTDDPTCANCGEASWSESSGAVGGRKIKTAKESHLPPPSVPSVAELDEPLTDADDDAGDGEPAAEGDAPADASKPSKRKRR